MEKTEIPESGRYDKYTEIGKKYFQMTDLDNADFAVLPLEWEFILNNQEEYQNAIKFINIVKNKGKKTIIFFWSDSVDKIPIEDTIIFRTSFYKSTKHNNEFAMPSWSEDFIEKYLGRQLQLREKTEKPKVGFCGLANLPTLKNIALNDFIRIIRKLQGKTPSENGHLFRGKVLQALSKSSCIDANFIIRNNFFGTQDLKYQKKARQEYLVNMLSSDYVICARGAGNFSYRLYETLCCGRIPVFIDTDCVLPYDFIIEWKKYCVWVDQSELQHIAEKVSKFHKSLKKDEFVELQKNCRKLWEEWVSPEGFFSNLHKHFEKIDSF